MVVEVALNLAPDMALPDANMIEVEVDIAVPLLVVYVVEVVMALGTIAVLDEAMVSENKPVVLVDEIPTAIAVPVAASTISGNTHRGRILLERNEDVELP